MLAKEGLFKLVLSPRNEYATYAVAKDSYWIDRPIFGVADAEY